MAGKKLLQAVEMPLGPFVGRDPRELFTDFCRENERYQQNKKIGKALMREEEMQIEEEKQCLGPSDLHS